MCGEAGKHLKHPGQPALRTWFESLLAASSITDPLLWPVSLGWQPQTHICYWISPNNLAILMDSLYLLCPHIMSFLVKAIKKLSEIDEAMFRIISSEISQGFLHSIFLFILGIRIKGAEHWSTGVSKFSGRILPRMITSRRCNDGCPYSKALPNAFVFFMWIYVKDRWGILRSLIVKPRLHISVTRQFKLLYIAKFNTISKEKNYVTVKK